MSVIILKATSYRVALFRYGLSVDCRLYSRYEQRLDFASLHD